MVLGGNKSQVMASEWLTKEYLKVFTEVINEDNTILQVIGYGFMDHYINNILCFISEFREIDFIRDQGSQLRGRGGVRRIVIKIQKWIV